MDWSKAKGSLIIALVLTNLILFGYVWYNRSLLRDETTTTDFIHKTEQLLANHEIKVDAYIPKSKSKLPTLAVELESYTDERVNRRFFHNEGEVFHPSSDRIEVVHGDEHVNIVNNRRIFYENTKESVQYELHNERDAQEIVEDFLMEHQFDNRDMELSFVKEEDGKYYLNYSKIVENVVLESSYTNFVVDERGVVSMDRLWLNVMEQSKQLIQLSSATRALLCLLEKPECTGKTIVKIEPCYYFNPEDQGYVEDITRALQGRAIPAWKIEFKDGENIVIDTY